MNIPLPLLISTLGCPFTTQLALVKSIVDFRHIILIHKWPNGFRVLFDNVYKFNLMSE